VRDTGLTFTSLSTLRVATPYLGCFSNRIVETIECELERGLGRVVKSLYSKFFGEGL
jgi:hypothetical protein